MKEKKLVDWARESMSAVVQIFSEGFSESSVHEELDPRYLTPSEWTGSGFFIKNEDGEIYILTNGHVIRNAIGLRVRTLLTSEETFKVKVLGYIESLDPDIALLTWEEGEKERFQEMVGEIPFLKMAPTNYIRRGTEVKAIGYPMGMEEPNLSGGEITNFISGTTHYTERIVTDAAINPGNSGGPTVVDGGLVIGINTAIIAEANNIGFITPIAYVQILIKNLIEGSEGRLVELGASIQKNSGPLSSYMGQLIPEGVFIKERIPDGLLDRAGLKPQDILLRINDFRIDRHGVVVDPNGFRKKNIYDITRLLPIGSEVEIEYFRERSPHLTKVKTCLTGQNKIRNDYDIFHKRFICFEGMIIQALSFQILNALAETYPIEEKDLIRILDISQERLVITHIDMDSQANDVYLDISDCITHLNEHKIVGLESFVEAYENVPADEPIVIKTLNGAMGVFFSEEEVGIETPMDFIGHSSFRKRSSEDDAA